jgi:hypothetical protein
MSGSTYEGKERGRLWNLQGGYSDQGLLSHWVKYVKMSASIVVYDTLENRGPAWNVLLRTSFPAVRNCNTIYQPQTTQSNNSQVEHQYSETVASQHDEGLMRFLSQVATRVNQSIMATCITSSSVFTFS